MTTKNDAVERVARAKYWERPFGDAGDALDFACDHCAPDEALAFLEDWRSDRAGEWPGYMKWLALQHAGAKEAAANRLSQEAVLRDALEQIAVYGCGMLNQPAELNGPEASWLRRRIEAYEQTARTALTGKQSANLGHSISTGNRTPV